MKHRVKGSMTVYFGITITVVLLLFCVLFKTSRSYIAEVGGRQTLDLCASSMLGGFNKELQENYGLYALVSVDEAQKELEYYMRKNLELENIEVISKAELTDDDHYDKQIADYMKYRFVISLITQYTDVLNQLEEAQQSCIVVEEEADTAGVLQQYNQYFSAFVSILEGIEENGARRDPSVKGFWNNEWKKEVYESILEEAKKDEVLHKGAVSGWVERIRIYLPVIDEAIQLWDQVCDEGQKVRQELQQMYSSAVSESVKEEIEKLIPEIHTGDSSDQNIAENLRRNKEVLETAKEGLDKLMEEKKLETALNKAEKLVLYTEDLYVNYELRSMKEKRSWNKLWNQLQDYTTDLSEYVSDKEVFDKESKSQFPSVEIDEDNESESLFSLPFSLDESLKNGIDMSFNRFYNIEYLTGLFWNLCEVIQKEQGTDIVNMNGEEKIQGVLKAEVEYVICGKNTDLANCRGTRRRIVAIRMMCNMIHLLTDKEKQITIKAAASLTGGIIAPGIGNIVMNGLITASWAAAESYTDYEQLIQGNKVPMLKNDKTWSTDLDSIWEKNLTVNNDKEEIEKEEGLLYVDYLKMILLLMSEEKVERRTQDLIQLNLQKMTGMDLYLTEMPVQFLVQGQYKVDRRTYDIEGEYGY